MLFPILLLKGSLIGLSVSMPMGPTGMLCLRYSVVKGKGFGLASGIGIALAEMLCAAVTAVGLTTITAFIETHQAWLQLIGSSFLFYFGLLTLKARQENPSDVIQSGHFLVFLKMFFFTLTNPLTCLSFIAIYSTIGLETVEHDLLSLSLLSFGVFLGSILWWVLISSSSSYFLGKIQSSSAKMITKIAGALIIVVSIVSFFSGLKLLLG